MKLFTLLLDNVSAGILATLGIFWDTMFMSNVTAKTIRTLASA